MLSGLYLVAQNQPSLPCRMGHGFDRASVRAQDWTAWHGSCDVSNGVKWAANFWWNLYTMRQQRKPRQ